MKLLHEAAFRDLTLPVAHFAGSQQQTATWWKPNTYRLPKLGDLISSQFPLMVMRYPTATKMAEYGLVKGLGGKQKALAEPPSHFYKCEQNTIFVIAETGNENYMAWREIMTTKQPAGVKKDIHKKQGFVMGQRYE